MKKFLSTLAVSGLAIFALASCTGGESGEQGGNGGNGDKTDDTTKTLANGDVWMSDKLIAQVNTQLKGEYDIKLWASETTGVDAEGNEKQLTAQMKEQAEAFSALFPDIKLNITVDAVGEGDAAGKMITAGADGADVYCFAQDQLARLVSQKCLNEVPSAVKSRVQANNEAQSVSAASTAGAVYAYPLTADNGYFMFYDKSIVKEESLGDIMKVLDDCAAAGKKMSYNILGGGWYTGGVFFGAGCHSTWTTNQGGFFMSFDDDFKANGLLAAKAIRQITTHSAYNAAEKAAEFEAGIPSAAVVSGTWDVATAKRILGENYACAELPSVTVGTETFHLGSFAGCKLVGVRPQGENMAKQNICHLLAEYLTLGQQQLDRFKLVGWGPSNVNAQKDDGVKADEALTALNNQKKYAVVQGQIQGDWWNAMTVLAKKCKEATTDAELQTALDEYDEDMKSKIVTDFKHAGTWSLIGAAVGGWDVDIVVAEPDDQGVYADGVYTVKVDGVDKVWDFAAGAEFKLRRGYAWGTESTAIKEGSQYLEKPNNISVKVAGSYYVQVSIVNNEIAWVDLVPANN